MKINGLTLEQHYRGEINRLIDSLKAIPDAQSLTICRDGSCSMEFGIDNTVVEMSAEALVEQIARAHKHPMPPTEHFYKLALERSAEIKRGENLEN